MAFLTDGTVSLRPVEREDLPLLRDWRNETELRTRTREFRPLTDIDQENWYVRISGPLRTDYMFCVLEDHEPTAISTRIGVIGLCHHCWVDATAEASFYIGNAWGRGKGYCKRALTLLIDWGFETLQLQRVYAEVFAFNEPSLNLLRKLGFQEEGTLRKHVWRMGKRWDSVMMGLLKEEWNSGKQEGWENGLR